MGTATTDTTLVTTTMSLATAREYAASLQAEDVTGTQNGAVMKCPACYAAWNDKGRRQEDKPPVFPPDFGGDCPMCLGKMKSSVFSG
jgi:hypothetical protein